jgi:AraC family transcriptional regulator, transcriptional activator FtrA
MSYIIKIMPSHTSPIPQTGPRVVAVAYDQLCTFEFGVAYEIFGLARPDMGPSWYRFQTACAEPGTLTAAGGLVVAGHGGLEILEHADLIIIPGWRGIESPVPEALLAALRTAHERGARIASLCSGVFVLAASGLLNGQRATTHWRYAEALAKRYSSISVEPDVLYVDNGQILTAAGSAAGIDLCLYIVRHDFGIEAANSVARRLVVPPHRDGGQAQFIRRPVPQSHESARLGAVMEWIRQHIDSDLAVAILAKRAGMSLRTFQRRFEEITGHAPGDFIIQTRVEAAQTLMEIKPTLALEEVARVSGFRSLETMRHHFRRRVKVSPKLWRARFAGNP